jgi:hypothetical protein
VALATHAGGLRAHHRCPGRPGGLGHPTAPTGTAPPSTRPRAADRPDPASPQARIDTHHRPAGADHLAHPLDPHPRGPTTTAEPVSAQAPATAGTTTSTEAFSTLGATSTQPPVTDPTTTAAPPTTAPTTTAGPTTTTLATTTSTEPPTTGPTTTSTEPTTTTGPASP